MSTFEKLQKADHVLVWTGEDKFAEIKLLQVKSGIGNVLEWQQLVEAIDHTHDKWIAANKTQQRPNKSTDSIVVKPKVPVSSPTRTCRGTKRDSKVLIDYRQYHNDSVRSAKSPKLLPRATCHSMELLDLPTIPTIMNTETTVRSVVTTPEIDTAPETQITVCRKPGTAVLDPITNMASHPVVTTPSLNNARATVNTVPRSVPTPTTNREVEEDIVLISPPPVERKLSMQSASRTFTQPRNLDDLLCTLNFDPLQSVETDTTVHNKDATAVASQNKIDPTKLDPQLSQSLQTLQPL